MDIFRTLIVSAAFVELAREIAASFGPGGANM
jgi:phosphoserine phosphatase